MTKYHRITHRERESIYSLIETNHNQTFIALQLGRNKSSISRELACCSSDPIGYIPDRANNFAIRFARRNPKIFRKSNLSNCIMRLPKGGWSPEQIAGRLKLENNRTCLVSHETIYRFIYSKEGLAQKLYLLLTRRKPKRTKWHSRKPRQSQIPESANIKQRTKVIEKRKKTEHFEGDLVVFGSLKGANVTTLVDENSNGRLRKYLPKKFDYRHLS